MEPLNINYIAHIHLASVTGTSLLGNFLGDFVKGKDLSWLPGILQQGIWLHRRIDSFTDSHQEVKDLKKTFPKSIRRMAGVCIDIWFDHLLLRNQSDPPNDFSSGLQQQIFEDFYQELAEFEVAIMTTDVPLPLPINLHHFQRVQKGLLTHQWLEDYKNATTCMQAFKSVEARLGHRIQFARQSFTHIQENEVLFAEVFAEFYPQLTEYAMLVSEQANPKPAR